MSTGQHSSSALEPSHHTKEVTRENVDAIMGSDANGIHPRKPHSEPLATHWHKPGVIASKSDRIEEFHAQTLPAGTAPRNHTFQPHAEGEIGLTGDNPSASSTIPGSTSSDVHTGLGHPGQGQTSTELRHDGAHTVKRQGAGLEGVGARVESKLDTVANPEQRALNRDDAQIGEGASLSGTRGDRGGPLAEERVPETAGTVAHENRGPRRD